MPVFSLLLDRLQAALAGCSRRFGGPGSAIRRLVVGKGGGGWQVLGVALAVLFLGSLAASAQSTSVLEWDFGSASYTTATSVKHSAVSSSIVTLGVSSVSGLSMSGAGTTGARYATTGSWNGTATTMTSGRTGTTPVSGAKVLYTTFTMGNTVA